MSFPARRMRRLRRTAAWRRMIEETTLRASDFVYPLFVVPGAGVRNPVPSMPGVAQLSVDLLVEEAAAAHQAGVPAVILFGIPEHKDERGSSGYDPEGVVPRAIAALKRQLPELLVWADVCLCEYTDHGHCGVLDERRSVDNDATLPLLARAALVDAQAGADAVAPSDMMDGRVAAIRRALDQAGRADTVIVAYAAKYASAYYGPFRDAAQSAPAFGDRRSYQMDPPNSDEALREVALDLEEGADLVMVKPAGPYLDVVRRVKDTFGVPTAAYQVSGEYSLIKAAGERQWVDERRVALESLVGIKRAGADLILTYYAKEAARWRGEGGAASLCSTVSRAATLSSGVSGRMPWPRFTMWASRGTAASSDSAWRRVASGPASSTAGSRLPWSARSGRRRRNPARSTRQSTASAVAGSSA